MLPCAMDFRFLNEPELHRGHGAFRFCDEVNMLDCPLVERNRPIGVILADRRRNEEAARQFHIYCNVLACIKLSGKIPFIGGIVEDIVIQVLMRLHSVVPQTSLHGRLGEDVCIIDRFEPVVSNVLDDDRCLLVVNKRGSLDDEFLGIVAKLPENGRMDPFEYSHNGSAGKTRFCDYFAYEVILNAFICRDACTLLALGILFERCALFKLFL